MNLLRKLKERRPLVSLLFLGSSTDTYPHDVMDIYLMSPASTYDDGFNDESSIFSTRSPVKDAKLNRKRSLLSLFML
ncbi:hypothetical protein JNB11_05870 [Kocuria palustris]|nr:hypothetical protein [Kocuria palustris]